MSESNMPVAEAMMGEEREAQAYELAFHILPTVAEGEVKAVFESIKNTITKLGGTLREEEAPARFELAYELVQFLEGRNRKFTSAYFGWVRFSIEADKIAELVDTVERTKEILRHLLIRLSKAEEANPFYFHPAIAHRVVETIYVEADEVVEEVDVEEVAAVEAVVEDGVETEEAV